MAVGKGADRLFWAKNWVLHQPQTRDASALAPIHVHMHLLLSRIAEGFATPWPEPQGSSLCD
jgi:hypothetical protein